MKKKFMVALLFLSLFFVFNVDASAKTKTLNEDRILVRLENKGNINSVKSYLAKSLGSIKSVESVKTKSGVVYVVNFKNKISKFNEKVKGLKNSNIRKVSYSFSYKIDPIKTKKNARSARIASNNWHVAATNSDYLKNEVADGNKVKVAVMDTGIQTDNKDIAPNLDKSLSRNFSSSNAKNYEDVEGHGTHVAGLIGGESNQSVGKNIDLVALKVFGAFGADTEDIISAIEYSEKNNIKLVNMSFGGSGGQYVDYELYEAMEKFSGVFVVAAGNDGINMVDQPAAYNLENVISVGATDSNGEMTSFSSYNKNDLHLYAPGLDVFSSCSISLPDCIYNGIDQHDEDNITSKLSGTSMSTPIVTGIIGTLMSTDNDVDVMKAKDAIIDGVNKKDSLKQFSLTGGIVDAKKSLEILKDGNSNVGANYKINNDGSVSLWGNNVNGKLGNGTNNDISEDSPYTYVISSEKIVNVTITSLNTFLITDKGNLYVAGDNSFNQLGQSNSNNSNEFVKFTKYDNSHFITNVSLRNSKGMSDEKTLTIKIKSAINNPQYYHIGKYSEKADAFLLSGKDIYENSKNLQYYSYKNGVLDKVLYLAQGNKKVTIQQQYKYEKWREYDEDDNFIGYYYYFNNLVITKKTSTKEIIKYDYESSRDARKIVYNYNTANKLIKRTTNDLDVEEYYDYINNNFVTKSYLRNKEDRTYSNGKVKKNSYYKYNSYGSLKSSSKFTSSLTVTNYNNSGKVKNIYYAKYDNKGKKSKAVCLQKNTYSKKYNAVIQYKYNKNLVRSQYEYLKKDLKGNKINYKKKTYNNKLTKYYEVRNYKKNKISNKKQYYYNKKGKLTKTITSTYNSKGKLVNKTVRGAK